MTKSSDQSSDRPKDGTVGADASKNTVSVDAAQAAGGEAEQPGTGIPNAGQHEMGVAGASGQSDNKDQHSGKENTTRKEFGVSGQDLQGDGSLPPQ